MQKDCILNTDIRRTCGLLSTSEMEKLIQQAHAAIVDYLPAAAPYGGSWAASIVVADNPAVQQLNQQFRGQDKPTNVLSFPAEDTTEDGLTYLGDIIIAADIIVAEAVAEGKPLEYHLQHMVVHGILHLMGYDHQTPDQATEMEALEIHILQQLGISNPYV